MTILHPFCARRNVSLLFATLAVTACFCHVSRLLASAIIPYPPPPTLPPAVTLTNVRVYQFPAELLLTWESSGADHYNISTAGADRRWRPLASHLTVTYLRTSDFLFLPGWYSITAYNSSNEYILGRTVQEIWVENREALVQLAGLAVRPAADNAMILDCSVCLPDTSGWIFGPVPGGAWATLEFGTSPTNMSQVVASPDFAQQHSFLLTDLQPGTLYWYRLNCIGTNDVGVSYVNSFTTQAYVEPEPVILNLNSDSPLLVTDENTPVRFTLTNDSPAIDFSSCHYFIARPPYSGQITGAYPNFLFTPDLLRCGGDSFECALVCDGTIVQNATVSVFVNFVNAPPVAQDASFLGAEDTPIPLHLGVYSFQEGPEPITCNIVSSPTNGTLWIDPYHVIYLPNTNFNGIDHIAFQANDGQTNGNVAIIRIQVTAVNDPPVAQDMYLTVVEGETNTFFLAGSDIDGGPNPYSRILYYNLVTTPQHGLWTDYWPGSFTYSASGYTGLDSFIYSVSDGQYTANGTVYINVVPPNKPPQAAYVWVYTEFGVPVSLTLRGWDPEGAALTYKIASGPSHGTLSGASPSLLYTPAPGFSGTDTFTYTVSDGELNSVPAMVDIVVNPEDAPPFAPVGLGAVATSDHQVTLTWVDRSMREKGYRIDRAVDGVTFKQIASVGENVCTFIDNGVHPGKTYWYRVSAYNKYGKSACWNTASATVPN